MIIDNFGSKQNQEQMTFYYFKKDLSGDSFGVTTS